VRFSKKSGQEARDTNHLVLLHGPPGSGKRTLCQGLAQKISIRLNSTYKNTTLVQVKPAALYSKYYSESAKEVDAIFTKLQEMCENDPEEFVCVLIDEVETIATSRGSSINDDCQESLRVTNALLTGLDRTKNLINIVILCTSNMPDSLDAAFLDRCGSRIFVNSPTVQSQYGILRGRIQKLIERGIITSNKNIPCYRDADLEANDDDASESDGGRLLGLVRLINSESFGSSVIALSGRSLTQLPEQALLRYLRDETCDLGMALTLMEQYIKSEQAQAKKPKSKDDEEMDEIWEDIEVLVRRKRKYANVGEFEQALGEIEDHVATFRNNFRERKRTALELKQEKG
jgi:SpoVK/Ycf46/Vps4 family AAA+-type ATPase